MKLVVSPDAADDLQRLREFLERESPGATARAASAIEQAILSLEAFPGRGRLMGPSGLREVIVPFGRSAYVLRYAHIPELETIVVVRIWHGREERDQPNR